MDLFSLRSKRAVVTGGATGIGFEMCKLFAQRGAHVYVLDINGEAAEAAANTINALPGLHGSATALSCDVTSPESVSRCFATVAASGGVDILANNAGIGHVGSVEVCELEDMDRVMRVNVNGAFLCAKYAVKHMVARGQGGVILNTASCSSVHPIQDRCAYATSKGAILTFTTSLATDLLKYGIRCNAVCPGRIHTPFVDGFVKKNYPGKEEMMFKQLSSYMPQGRMGTPGEVAALALYMVSDEARFVTGAAFSIDGGIVGVDHPKAYDQTNPVHPAIAAKL